eukprot:2063143-Rhodomonas_salina.1
MRNLEGVALEGQKVAEVVFVREHVLRRRAPQRLVRVRLRKLRPPQLVAAHAHRVHFQRRSTIPPRSVPAP